MRAQPQQQARRAELVPSASVRDARDRRGRGVTAACVGLGLARPAVPPQQSPRRAAAIAACVEHTQM